MHDVGQFVDDALALRGVRGHPHLEDGARYAFAHGKLLQVVAHRRNDPELRVIDEPTGRWLSLPIESDTDEIEGLVDTFDAQYDQLEIVDEFEESLPARIVDILIEGDMDDFISSFSKSQEIVGGQPLDPMPSGKKVLRAVEFYGGYKLYLWRTDRQREYYGSGPNSFYLGYRFVSPSGQIIYEDVGFHPGGSWNGDITDDVVLMLIQGLILEAQDVDWDDPEDEVASSKTPIQKAFLLSDDRDAIEADVGGIDSLQGGPPPWKEIPIRGRRKRS